ncbi:MAG: 1-deoxy-D-xylulose-5-phosphate reductoisomerase [Clostridia bacterium]|nr:1-deoxy-D-xylulose-5-phosphate reductoisomerase [Clostridia bacterium]
MKKIALIGSTGSIGRQVLQVVDKHPESFKIVSLCANKNAKLLSEQISRYKPVIATLTDSLAAQNINSLPTATTFYYGENSMLHAVCKCADIVFVAVTGFAGLKAVLSAINQGKTVALANKESLVCGGEIVTRLAKEKGVQIIPVDSEHSAIWQCLDFDREKPFEKLILTASGGAFRDLPLENLDSVTAEDALKHPNWDMGKKITIDCATMVNKAFEVIEAKWLFNTTYDKIDVLVHPQSIVHSMVSFRDGSVIAQLARADMKLPIALALTYPERVEVSSDKLSLVGKSLDFLSLDDNRYPCFSIVMEAAKRGGVYPCAVSCANEVAVEYFLQGKIKFSKIQDVLRYVLDNITPMDVTYDNLVGVDKLAKSLAISRLSHN